METRRHVGEEGQVGTGVPAVVGCQLLVAVGHEGDLRGARGEHEVHELGFGVALYVELRGDERLEVAHVLAADVALVGARMHGDALCAKALAILRHAQHVGVVAAPRVAQCGNLVDVHAKSCHR